MSNPEQDHGQQPDRNTVASKLGGMFLSDSAEAGNIIRVPSLGMRLGKMLEVFPEPPHTQTEIITGFHSAFPDASLAIEDSSNLGEIKLDIVSETEQGRAINTYYAVSTEGSLFYETQTAETYEVVRGQGIVVTQHAYEPEAKHMLEEGNELTIPSNSIFTLAAREGWAIFWRHPMHEPSSE